MNDKGHYQKEEQRNFAVVSSLAACLNSELPIDDKIAKYNDILSQTNLQFLTLCAGLPEISVDEIKEALDDLMLLKIVLAQQKGISLGHAKG